MNSRKHDARIAGALYLLLAAIASFGGMYIPSVFIVSGDAAATADRIVSSALIYRLGIVADLASYIIFVFVVLALYRLLKDVDRGRAAVMLALALVSVPMSFAILLCQIAPLVLLSGADYLSAFDKQQLEALAMAFLKLRSQGIAAAFALWGLWLLPFGLLVYRSGFIPRIFGVLLIVNCFAYLAMCLTRLLFPAYGPVVSQWMMLPALAGELSIILWLLIKGVRDQPEDQASSSGKRVAASA